MSVALSVPIPDTHRDLLEKPVYAGLTTVMPDGQPQSTVVWLDYDGQYVRLNSASGRQKDRNIKRNPKVTVLLIDPENPYRWLEVRGTVDEITEEGAVDHIEKLSWKYKGQGYYGGYSKTAPDQETRVMYKMRPTRVTAYPKR
jgi:PPOX class probable F420-dependent enzyme